MLQKYSWSEYWLTVVVVIAIYYAIVLLILYRNGLLPTFSFKKPSLPQNPQKAFTVPAKAPETRSVAPLSNQSEVEAQMKSLIEEVSNFLQDLVGKSYVKEEIIMGLQVIFRDYQEFANTNYQPDINEFIVAEVENFCSVDLSSEEVSRVWMG